MITFNLISQGKPHGACSQEIIEFILITDFIIRSAQCVWLSFKNVLRNKVCFQFENFGFVKIKQNNDTTWWTLRADN